MVDILKKIIINHWLKDEDLQKAGWQHEEVINHRVAAIVSTMDPFEPFMKRFKGTFSHEFDHPEEKLDQPGQLGMWMWAYGQDNDRFFKFLVDWIIDTQANATIKRRNVTSDEILYSRAKIASIIQFRDEVRRLANLYRDYMDREREDPDNLSVVE